MLARRFALAALSALWVAAACDGSNPAVSEEPPLVGLECEIGDTRPCQGAAECTTEATQTCLITGVGWSACSCPRGLGGAGGTGGAGGAGGAGGEAGANAAGAGAEDSSAGGSTGSGGTGSTGVTSVGGSAATSVGGGTTTTTAGGIGGTTSTATTGLGGTGAVTGLAGQAGEGPVSACPSQRPGCPE